MSTIFSIKVHHGGVFTSGQNKQYIGGKIDVMDSLDSDLLSLHEMDSISHFLGYGPPVAFYFVVPGLSLDIGLVHMKGDDDVRAMIASVTSSKIAELYIEHIGGVNVLERETDDGEFNTDELLGDEDVGCGEGSNLDEDDDSTDDIIYSDSSYDMTDDDVLYETFVDDDAQFMGLGESSKKTTNTVEEGPVENEEIILSDDYYETEDENPYISSSDDDNTKVKEHPFKKFRSEVHMEDPPFELGMEFASATVFKDAVKQHAIKHRRNVQFVKNDKLRVRATCQKKCPWKIYARKVLAEESFQIRTYNSQHKCGISFTNRNINSSMIAKKYMGDLRNNPSMPITAFKERVRKELKVDVSRSQLYRARRKAAKLIYGDDIAQYGRLWDYCEEIRRSNPGSTVVMDAPLDEDTGQPRFNRLYICLAACKSGFIHGCRKLIRVDGCHLKGPYIGILLTAIGVDANESMYPIAYCVVETESTTTWKWIFHLLGLDLGITPANEAEFTFINDRQKGMQAALDEVFPRAEHRHCCKHLLANFMKKFKGLSLEEKFWNCAKSTNVPQFELAMECMKEEDAEAYQYLMDEPARYWSRSHFKEIVKSDMVCNNMCEAFNKSILDARDKPIIEMLEWIRSYLVNRRVLRGEWIRRLTHPMLSNIFQKLENCKATSHEAIADWCGELIFQVRTTFSQYTVDLGGKTCSCRKWDLCGIPCRHTIAAIENRKHDPESYVNPCYSKEAYARAYHPLIMPINGYQMWPKTGFAPVLPPLEKRKLGRPKMARRRDPSEYINPKDPNKLRRIGQNSVFCRKCGKHGHNRTTCTYDGDEEVRGTNSVGRGRGRGSTNTVPRGRGRGSTNSVGRGRGRCSTSEAGIQSPAASDPVDKTRVARGRKVRGQNPARMSSSQPVGGQIKGTRVVKRGGAIGGRVQWRGHEANIPTNYAQATQSSQTAPGSTTTKSTSNRFYGGQKFVNISAL